MYNHLKVKTQHGAHVMALTSSGQHAHSYVLLRAIVNVDKQKYWNINCII